MNLPCVQVEMVIYGPDLHWVLDCSATTTLWISLGFHARNNIILEWVKCKSVVVSK